eukprot:14735185-Ditylum_brightwellii.AAC.1
MAKTRTNRMGAGALENNEMSLPTAGTPTNSAGSNATGAAMGGDATVSTYCVVGNPSGGRRMHSKTVQCYDAC